MFQEERIDFLIKESESCTWTMMIGPPLGKSRGRRTEKSLVYQDVTASM